MSRTTKVQMALEDAYDWDDGTLEDYVNQVETERDELKRRVEELESFLEARYSGNWSNWQCDLADWKEAGE